MLIALILLIMFMKKIYTYMTQDEERIGKIKVNGNVEMYVEIFQSTEFDWITPVTGRVLDKNNNIISLSKTILNSSDSEKISSFSAFCLDSIVYITYEDSTNVIEVYNLKSSIEKQYNLLSYDLYKQEDSLFNFLKKHKPYLKKSVAF